MSERGLLELHNRKLLKGIKLCKIDFCESCVLSKQCRVKFITSNKRSKNISEYVHSDVWGPSPVTSLGGAKYFVTFIDDYLRKVWVYFLQHKSEVFEKFKYWKANIEKTTGKYIKVLRTDNGGEYTSKEFQDFCLKEGITRHFTIPNTPQQNGVAERMNRTLLERERCMRLFAGLSKSFWAESVNTTYYLVNRSPSLALELKSPEEVWLGKPVDYSNLHIFSCPVYILLQDTERTKLDSKSKRCIFMGYASDVKWYKVWDPNTRKSELCKDIRFDETSMFKKSQEKI
ncbi:Retrovirus-related Pol polyprotein from transposon TNT 1-94 [Apostasia shenzhenica]|uniref:Retrovirus-related Pol polyprotein from transposon TNT 1-94 n=1 Tax=Apostasia shenzhenica TaxID=1088818 RepID=A0A2I0AI06_9ASPA|nr:Retrovirus-related Pol polyprotein from transposon TNT 1-94 [Apostasia shenzhenica]